MSREADNNERFLELFAPRVTRKVSRGVYELSDGRLAFVRTVRFDAARGRLRCSTANIPADDRVEAPRNVVAAVFDADDVWVWDCGKLPLGTAVTGAVEDLEQSWFAEHHRFETWAENH